MAMGPLSPPESSGQDPVTGNDGYFPSSAASLPLSNHHLASLAVAESPGPVSIGGGGVSSSPVGGGGPSATSQPSVTARSRSSSHTLHSLEGGAVAAAVAGSPSTRQQQQMSAINTTSTSNNASSSSSAGDGSSSANGGSGSFRLNLPLSPTGARFQGEGGGGPGSGSRPHPSSPNSLSAAFPHQQQQQQQQQQPQQPSNLGQSPVVQAGEWGQAIQEQTSFFPVQDYGYSQQPTQQQQMLQQLQQPMSAPPLPSGSASQSQPPSPSRTTGLFNFSSAIDLSSSLTSAGNSGGGGSTGGRPRSTTVGSFQHSAASSGQGSSNHASPVPSGGAGFGSFSAAASATVQSPVATGSSSRGGGALDDSRMSGIVGSEPASRSSSAMCSSNGGGLPSAGPSAQDLAAQVKAMSLESRLRDIEDIIAASEIVTQQAALLRTALIDGREAIVSHGDLKEIGDTLKAIASPLPPSAIAPHPGAVGGLSLLPSSTVTSPVASGAMDMGGSSDGSVAAAAAVAAAVAVTAAVASLPTLSIDVAKSLSSSSKRPLPVSSPVPSGPMALSDVHLHHHHQQHHPPIPKHPRRSEIDDGSLYAGSSSSSSLQPPPLQHAHSFPNTTLQSLPSESTFPGVTPTTPSQRAASTIGVPLAAHPSLAQSQPQPLASASATANLLSSLPLQQQQGGQQQQPLTTAVSQMHASIVPSPLAMTTSRPPSPGAYLEAAFQRVAASQQQQDQEQHAMFNTSMWDTDFATPGLGLGQPLAPTSQPPPGSASTSSAGVTGGEQQQTTGAGQPASTISRSSSTSRRTSTTSDGRPIVRLRGMTLPSDSELPTFLQQQQQQQQPSNGPSSVDGTVGSPQQQQSLASSSAPSSVIPARRESLTPDEHDEDSYYSDEQDDSGDENEPPFQTHQRRRRASSRARRRSSPRGFTATVGGGGGGGSNATSTAAAAAAQALMDADEGALMGQPALDGELKLVVDGIFLRFLNTVCSDITLKDSKGEQIHQTLMPKKMQRLDESWDFRPFKFRIQAFTNAFTDELQREGLGDEVMPVKKVKHFLWQHPFISRFNDDGKKAKSKGNHIWNVEAKKDGSGGWIFREFQRKITGAFPSVGHCGVPWKWSPRVWDPHASTATIKATFSSPPGSLPAWLSWKNDNVLSGTPPAPGGIVHIEAIATYTEEGVTKQLGVQNTLEYAPFLVGQELSGMAMSRASSSTGQSQQSQPPQQSGFANLQPIVYNAPGPQQASYALPSGAQMGVPPQAFGPGPGGFVGGPAVTYIDPSGQQPQPVFQQQTQHPVGEADRNVLAAQSAVVQAVEEKGFGLSHQHSDPRLVSESSNISHKVLAEAHAARQAEFMANGFVTPAFAQKTVQDASVRAQQAIFQGAGLLGPQASPSDIIRAGATLLDSGAQQQAAAVQQQQQQMPPSHLGPGAVGAPGFNSSVIGSGPGGQYVLQHQPPFAQ